MKVFSLDTEEFGIILALRYMDCLSLLQVLITHSELEIKLKLYYY